MKKLIILLLSFSFSITSYSQVKMDQGDKLKDLLRMIRTYYTDTVDEEKITEAAINKMLEELDPHSSYVPARDLKRTEEGLVGNFEGIGVTFQLFKDTILILEVIPSGPSEKVGILAGDKIVKINDTVVAGIKIVQTDVIKKLRGPKNTTVKVKILRKNALLDFVITRDKIPIYSIEASYMATPTTGYIKLTRFAAPTMQEFAQAMEKLKAQGMQNLILDLQGNSGGYLNTAASLCNEFIKDDKQLIVYTEGKHANREPYYSNGKGSFGDPANKLIVLIDDGSASASEIVSGCIQDIDRGLIIGRRSFGKGLVQKPQYFPDGSMVRLTVAHYFTPSGRCIQRPYEKGKKDYYDEYSRRLKSGELFGNDSLKFPDSLMFYTKNKRKVYGAGGVVPDIYVPVDTNWNSAYFQGLRGKGVLNNFCLDYVDKNREQLKKTYPSTDDFVANFMVTPQIKEQLYTLADKDSIKRDADQMKRSDEVITNQIKCLIGRDLFDNTTFWRIANLMNDPYKKAIETLSSDAFETLTPSKKELKKVEKEIKAKEKSEKGEKNKAKK